MFPYRAVRHTVALADGDAIVLHDDCPAGWTPANRVVLMMHGLAGCHQSGYMVRIAGKLNAVGVRTFRMDLRRCGAGVAMARLPYHAGRSPDALEALISVGHLCEGAPTTLVGFSLGGNIALKLLGESSAEIPGHVVSAMAVNPSLDLGVCVDFIKRMPAKLYDRHFVRLLNRQIEQAKKESLNHEHAVLQRMPRGLREFDDLYTAPLCGFGTADRYYDRCSAAQFVRDIRVPTLILASRDDPLIPARCFEDLALRPPVSLYLADHGGHLGYIGRRGIDADRRWMEWRVLDWVNASPGITTES